MSGEVSGLQTRLRHLSPHANYINCWNHRLHLIFVHLLKENESLSNVDTHLLLVWKMMKYSSVKCAVSNIAQEIVGLPMLKLLKHATTRWLSHGEASQILISHYKPLVNALDTSYFEK